MTDVSGESLPPMQHRLQVDSVNADLTKALRDFDFPRFENTRLMAIDLYGLGMVSFESFSQAHPQTNLTEDQFEQMVGSYGHQILNFGNNELKVEPGIDSHAVSDGQQITFRVRAGIELAARLFRSPFFDQVPPEPFLPVRMIIPTTNVPHAAALQTAEDDLRKLIKKLGGVHVGHLRVASKRIESSEAEDLKEAS